MKGILLLKVGHYRRRLIALLRSQDGLNTVELVVIMAIIIGLALLFRNRINGFVVTLLDGLFSDKTAEDLVKGVTTQ